MKCPICNNELEYIDPSKFVEVMDGNSIYQCKEESHRFWIHPFKQHDIYWHPKADNVDWDYFLWWKIEGDKYIPQIPKTDDIVTVVNRMFKEKEELHEIIRDIRKKVNK